MEKMDETSFCQSFFSFTEIANLTEEAQKGDANAQFDLGRCYENGEGVKRSLETAVEWFRKAAEQGHEKAQNYLESNPSLEQGPAALSIPSNDFLEQLEMKYLEALRQGKKYNDLIEKPSPKEFHRLQTDAEQGDARAQFFLGWCYDTGNGVERSLEEAVKWFLKSAEEGDAKAQCSLGACYYNGEGVEQSLEEAVKWFRKAAEQGHAGAQNNLGQCYENGNGVEQSLEEAAEWFRKAAEQGHVAAQFNMGWCYKNGEGVEQSFEEAAEWFGKAAEEGHEEAQNYLGEFYYSGEGVERSLEEAAKWYLKSAHQGYADAQYSLGLCYEKGQGVERSLEEAVEWFRKAADQGEADAQYSLGECYENGQGVEQSLEEAAEWYRKAAEQGDTIAQFSLGECYEKGNGVEQSLEEAIEWYRKAAEQGDVRAQNYLLLFEDQVEGVEQPSVELIQQNHQEGSPKIDKGKLLGRGAMGTVYECQMEGERGTLALKIAEVPEKGKARDLALQEVELLRSLDHPNIVPLVAIQRKTIPMKPTEDNTTKEREEIWMVMELFNDSLKGILAKKEKKWFREKELLKWMIQILSGLEYIHGKRIAHRDIKSDNVLVKLRGRDTVDKLCLADFGVARIVGEESQAATVVGTTAYKAPEVNEHAEYDPLAADMWSIGVLLCELAVGKPIPFPQLTEEKKIEKGNYSNILELASQCCSYNPKERPSATQLLQLCHQQL